MYLPGFFSYPFPGELYGLNGDPPRFVSTKDFPPSFAWTSMTLGAAVCALCFASSVSVRPCRILPRTLVFLDRSFPICRAQQALVMGSCSFSSESTSTSKQSLLVYLPYLRSSSRMFFPTASPPFRTGLGHQQLESAQ